MLEFFDIVGIRDFLDILGCLINTRIAHDLIFLLFFFVNKNGGIISYGVNYLQFLFCFTYCAIIYFRYLLS